MHCIPLFDRTLGCATYFSALTSAPSDSWTTSLNGPPPRLQMFRQGSTTAEHFAFAVVLCFATFPNSAVAVMFGFATLPKHSVAVVLGFAKFPNSADAVKMGIATLPKSPSARQSELKIFITFAVRCPRGLGFWGVEIHRHNLILTMRQ